VFAVILIRVLVGTRQALRPRLAAAA